VSSGVVVNSFSVIVFGCSVGIWVGISTGISVSVGGGVNVAMSMPRKGVFVGVAVVEVNRSNGAQAVIKTLNTNK